MTSPYDADGDCVLYGGAHGGERFLMTPGRWCLVMPEDAHMPGVSIDDAPAPVKKAVFKVRVEHLAERASPVGAWGRPSRPPPRILHRAAAVTGAPAPIGFATPTESPEGNVEVIFHKKGY